MSLISESAIDLALSISFSVPAVNGQDRKEYSVSEGRKVKTRTIMWQDQLIFQRAEELGSCPFFDIT